MDSIHSKSLLDWLYWPKAIELFMFTNYQSVCFKDETAEMTETGISPAAKMIAVPVPITVPIVLTDHLLVAVIEANPVILRVQRPSA